MSHQDSDGTTDGPTAEPPPALDLTQLRTFLAVHRAGSFTGAARLLGLSQPTVTAQIRALEARLGRELFERRARGVLASPYADDLAAQVAAPLDALAAVADRGGPDGAGPAEPVHLAGPAELLCTRALPALAPLVERGVRLRISTGLSDELLDGLRAGRHDLAVATSRPRGRTLLATPLGDEEFVLVAASAWAARIGPDRVRTEGPAALRGVPLVTYAEDLPIARRYWRHVFGLRLSCRAAVVVPDLRGVLATVAAGGGFSVLPRYLCQDELADGRLVALLEPADPPINTAYLVQRPGPAGNPHIALVRAELLRAARHW
ncbi:LysR family transcriptional regulator [Kitasatospora sp. McL0602]|uniref:LysR family transcriptional regulator n=1 Tax=Kitasatospora sp. McL0602 TaxID=3439530 RepID=UPI003F8C167E